MGRLVGFLGGATLGTLLAIGYDTSAQTAALEGGQRHLTFGAVIGIAALAAIVGAAIGERIDRKRKTD